MKQSSYIFKFGVILPINHNSYIHYTFMKKVLAILITLAMGAGVSYAQKSFEGTITYKISMEGEGAAQMAGMMPESYVYKIKESKMKVTMNGGMMASMMGDIVFDNEKEEGYMIQHSSSVAYKMMNSEEDKAELEKMAEELKPDVQATNETTEIAGYKCKKYVVKMSTPQGDLEQTIWATEGLNVKRPKNSSLGGGMSGISFVDGIDGFPLKMSVGLPMGMGTMTLTASTIDKGGIADAEFEVPSNYEIKDFDPSMFGGGGKY